MKIKRADIRDYKRMLKKQWHDQKFHSYMSSYKSMAIRWAINESRAGDHVRDITENANKYYQAVYGSNNG